ANVRKVIPYDHPARPAYTKSMNKLAENRAKLRDLQEQMAAVTGKGKKAKAKIDEIIAESEKINNANKVLQSQMDRLRLKDGVDIGDYTAKLTAERAAYASNVTSKFS